MLIPQTEVLIREKSGAVVRRVVAPGEYVIGCETSAEIPVVAESVSEKHARLTVNYNEWLIEDLGSAEGTFVNGKAVTQPTRVFPSQKITLGEVTLELRRAREDEQPDVSLAPATAEVRRLLPEELRSEKKYEIGQVVAQGGMGAILDAKDRSIRRTVAMKVMLESGSREHLLRFVEEAQITGQLEHPNIVPIHEIGVDEQEQPYYTMKFVKGVTLRAVLDKLAAADPETVKEYPLRRLLIILLRVCDAIAFANSKGVVHRDLKPDNIMIGDFGETLVMDWGLAKIIGRKEETPSPARTAILSVKSEDAASCTMAGTVMGTPFFMAPEQAAGEIDQIDARTDVYAIGAILYNILTLRPPVTGGNIDEVLRKVRAHEIETATSFNSPPAKYPRGEAPLPHCPGRRIPNALSAIAMKALSLAPADRYPTASELKADLDAWLAGFATKAEQAGLAKQIALLVGRHKGIFATAAAAWLIITLLAVYFVTGIARERHAAERQRDRAENALEHLRAQAPAFAKMAETYIEQLNLPAALSQLDSAIQLDPERGEYHARRGDVLQSLFRFAESASSYAEAAKFGWPQDKMAAAAALSARLEKSVPPGKEPGAAELNDLHNLLMQQERLAEAVLIAPRLVTAREAQRRTFAARVKQMHPDTLGDGVGMFTPTADGRFDVDLGLLQGRNERTLESLRGVPLRSLLVSAPTADLSPLAGQRLESLTLSGCPLTSLQLLRGMPLRQLTVTNAPLTSLEGLEGAPLEILSIGNTKVRDLSPLKGAPLQRLDANGASNIQDLSPLSGMPLEILNVAHNRLNSLEPLRGMKLRSLNIALNRAILSLEPLRGMPLEELNAGSTGIKELEPLAGMPLKRLSVESCFLPSFARLRDLPLEYLNVRANHPADFEVIQHLKLKGLNACNTDFADGNILAGQPLEVLLLSRCSKLKDVSFLKDLPNLKALTLPAELIPAARGLPGIRYLSTQDVIINMPTLESVTGSLQRATDFWASFDDPNGRKRLESQDNLRARLHELGLDNLPPENIKTMPSGLIDLDLSGTSVSDLSFLNGIWLYRLAVSGTQVSSLAPLAGMPLKRLNLEKCSKVSDLSPLSGMSLEGLDISGTAVRDLSVLAGMPVDLLRCNFAPISDLRPLKGMPLKILEIEGCSAISDLTPLAGLPLETLRLNNVPVRDLSVLKGMPLKRLDLQTTKVRDLKSLQGLKLTWLDLHGTPVADLSPLAGMPLTYLSLNGMPVSNLEPLRGMAIYSLHIGLRISKDPSTGTNIVSLDPLRGMPLKELSLDGFKGSDFSPLLDCPQLERLILPVPRRNIDVLKKHPGLKTLSWGFPGGWDKLQPAEQFWKEYDAGKK